jgi:hypothetical protein
MWMTMTDSARRRAADAAARRDATRRRGEHRLWRAITARRGLTDRHRGGRTWLNGRELGDTPARFAHLEASHD